MWTASDTSVVEQRHVRFIATSFWASMPNRRRTRACIPPTMVPPKRTMCDLQHNTDIVTQWSINVSLCTHVSVAPKCLKPAQQDRVRPAPKDTWNIISSISVPLHHSVSEGARVPGAHPPNRTMCNLSNETCISASPSTCISIHFNCCGRHVLHCSQSLNDVSIWDGDLRHNLSIGTQVQVQVLSNSLSVGIGRPIT